MYVVCGKRKAAAVSSVQPGATHSPAAKWIIPAVFIFTDSCLHYSYHKVRNVDFISLLSVQVFLGFKSQLQLVWVHVSLCAIAACHWRPTTNFLLSTCCSGSTMLSPSFLITIRFYYLKLVFQNHLRHRHQWVTHRGLHIWTVHIKPPLSDETDGSVHGSSQIKNICKVLVCIYRAVSVREIKLMFLCFAEVRFA